MYENTTERKTKSPFSRDKIAHETRQKLLQLSDKDGKNNHHYYLKASSEK